jgi:Carboxypeptidase regulatory-like domain
LLQASLRIRSANGKERISATNDQGVFVISGLEPGIYKIHVASAGFAAYENSAVELTAGRTQQLDVTLKVFNQPSESIESRESGQA